MNDLDLVKNLISNLELFDQPTVSKWIAPLNYIGTTNNIVVAGAQDKSKAVWINTHILQTINDQSKDKLGLIIKVISLSLDDLSSDPADEAITPVPTLSYSSTNLRSKFTFENFVQVDQNRMAYSFANSVANFPAKSYNPLYIYSDVGLGKTHLLYAIGNHIHKVNTSLRVIYTTTSEFMHEYVEHNRLNKRPDFINKYTNIDVLLIDDIQYITKWGGTSEQFYYIFNKLIQMEKQIVLCSDKHPDNIPDLEHRIKSRFEWGGIVDILHYDLEGRLAILKNKLTERRHLLKYDFIFPDEVLEYIANSITDNVRKLEGALNRLIGFANLKFDNPKEVISLEFTKEALKTIIKTRKKTLSILQIQEYIAKECNITRSDICSKSNKRDISHPRQIAMFICKKLINTPLNEIGIEFGGKHHSTVLHSINKIENMMIEDYDFKRLVDSYIKFLED